MTRLDHDALRSRARALRAEELRRMGRAVHVKWTTFLRRSDLSLKKDAPDAPLPCQVPAPSHP